MTDATELDEAAIRARVEAATEGPWRVVVDHHRGYDVPEVSVWSDTVGAYVTEDVVAGTQSQFPANAEFIAHARTDLPAALDEITRLRAALDEARAEVERVKMQHDECHHAFVIARDGLTAAESALAAVRALADECASSACIHLNEMWGRLRALLASSAPATAWDLHADLTAQVNDWDERVPRWVIARLRSILAAHTPPSATEPIHDDDCDSRGCTHCEVCGVGVLYGSRCSAHPMPDSSGEVALPATGVTSSDGDRGLSDEELDALLHWLHGGAAGGIQSLWAMVERILAARTAQPEGVEEWGHAHADDPEVVVVTSEASARSAVAGWNSAHGTDGKGLLMRRVVGPWEVVGDE